MVIVLSRLLSKRSVTLLTITGSLALAGLFCFNPAHAGEMYQRGLAAFKLRQYDRAADFFKQATATDNTNPEVYYYYALSLDYAGNKARAREVYVTALKCFPGTASAYNSQKAIQLIDKNYPTAKNGAITIVAPRPVEPVSIPVQAYLTPVRKPGQDNMPDAVVIPYELHNGLMLVDLMVNGRSTKFCFDTGSETVAIGKNHLLSWGLPVPKGVSKAVARGVGDLGAQPVWETNLDLRLGSIERRAFTVQVQDQMDVGPLMGLSFYRDYTYTIDSGAKLLRLQKRARTVTTVKAPETFNANDSYSVPFVRTGHEPLVVATVNGKPVTMVFDTGAMGVSLTEEQCKNLGVVIPDDAPVVPAKGIQGATTARVVTINSIKLGPIERNNFTVHVYASPKGGIGLIGQTLLSGYTYTVDHEAGVIRFAHRN